MISFQQVSKSFGGQDVLRDASFQVNPGEHVGVVGPNGAGKSTLFEMIIGEMSPDRGTVTVPGNLRIGYLRQELRPAESNRPLLDYVQDSLSELGEIHGEIEAIEARLATGSEGARAAQLRRLGELQTRYEHLGGYELRSRAEAALGGMGFTEETLTRPLATFSGGWQMRAELIRTLLGRPDVLLLDEPSNYLDIPAVEWLQRYLRDFEGTMLLISHDRYLLNTLTAVTIEVANARVERYGGGYAFYAEERVRRYDQRLAAARNQDRKREQMERFVERFRAKNTFATRAQSVMKKIEKMEEIEVPEQIRSRGRIRLPAPPHCGREVMRLEDVGYSYDGEHWVLRHVDLGISRGEKIALVGLNGTGKTTLMRVLAGQLEPAEGRRVVGHKVESGYQSQEFAELMNPDRSVFDTVRSVAGDVTDQYVRTLLGGFGFSGDAVDKPVRVLSGGEKIRLAFARLLVKPPNFLVLDEPTTHLDIQARERLEEALREYEGTLCVVSHDIEFVRRVADSVIAMAPPGVQRYPGGYDYYKEKTGGVEKGPAAPKTVAATAAPAAAKRDEKRRRAEAVQAHSRERRPLQKRVAAAEAAVEKMEAERAQLVQTLSGDATRTDFAAVNRRLIEIEKMLAWQTREWEEAAAELESIDRPGPRASV